MAGITFVNAQNGQQKSVVIKNEAPIFKQREYTSRGWVWAGSGNLYFRELAKLVDGSGMASACVSTKSKFIKGGGFDFDKENKNLATFFSALNPELLTNTASDSAYFDGYAWLVRYNANGNITEVKHIDFTNIALGIANRDSGKIESVFVSADWSKWNNSIFPWAAPVEIPVFNPDPKVVRGQMLQATANNQPWYGQILYRKRYTPGRFYYCPPSWVSADDRCDIDREIGKFHSRNLENGFMPSHWIYLPGTDWDDAIDEDGTKKSDKFKRDFKEKKQGAKNAGEVFYTFGPDKDSAPQIMPFQANVNGDMFLTLENNTVKYIPNAFQVPSILAGLIPPGQLGQSQQLLDTIEYFQNMIISPMQDDICNDIITIQQHFEGFNQADLGCKIAIRKPITYLPDKILDSLSADEKRAYAGMPEMDSDLPPEMQKVINRLNSMNQTVAAAVVARLDDATVYSLLGLAAPDTQPVNPDPNAAVN